MPEKIGRNAWITQVEMKGFKVGQMFRVAGRSIVKGRGWWSEVREWAVLKNSRGVYSIGGRGKGRGPSGGKGISETGQGVTKSRNRHPLRVKACCLLWEWCVCSSYYDWFLLLSLPQPSPSSSSSSPRQTSPWPKRRNEKRPEAVAGSHMNTWQGQSLVGETAYLVVI